MHKSLENQISEYTIRNYEWKSGNISTDLYLFDVQLAKNQQNNAIRTIIKKQ